ncbi:hypothetical protein SCUCBS95973_006082 [Sporothrix curviconia]|uniref:Centromere protein H C-terminal domain-containing protein n=1 Tax=Sporothrix curviconia TaxID=1260050 RepID=A0ABP0C2L9_9PEZI
MVEMEQEPRPITHDDLHATYVDRSIRELQRAVQEEEGVLAELRRGVAGAAPVTSAAASLTIMTTAYEAAARSDPFLPFADSVLPALLALRKTHGVLAESQVYLESGDLFKKPTPSSTTSTTTASDQARRKLAMDKARLDDQRALQTALETRIVALRSGLETRRTMTADEKRQEALNALHTKKRDYDRDTAALLKSLKQFIQNRLGPMLAAEELGGPVVGGMMDVQADDLAAGFSSQGKPRKARSAQASDKASKKKEDRRQRRIDEIWGPRAGGGGSEDGDDDNGSEDGGNWDEATAAAAEMQELTEELLNALASAGGDSSAAYVTITRESAAARFLVRSKVAHFHPRDATRLRLVDFGRELDD